MNLLRQVFGLMLIVGLLYPLAKVSLFTIDTTRTSYGNPQGESTFSPNGEALTDWDTFIGTYAAYVKTPFYFFFVYLPLAYWLLVGLVTLFTGDSHALGIEKLLLEELGREARKTRSTRKG